MDINKILDEVAKELGTAIMNKIIAQEQLRELKEATDGDRNPDD